MKSLKFEEEIVVIHLNSEKDQSWGSLVLKKNSFTDVHSNIYKKKKNNSLHDYWFLSVFMYKTKNNFKFVSYAVSNWWKLAVKISTSDVLH
jgi:hypothetical protein